MQLPHTLYLDFETRSAVDIKTAGAHKYAEHSSTDILCVGWVFDNDEPTVQRPDELQREVLQHVKKNGRIVAHNAAFEYLIWNHVGFQKYAYYEMPLDNLICTMARAYAMGFPGSLEHASAAAGIEHRKDMKGHRLMMKMSKPKKRVKCDTGETYEWHEGEEEMQRLFAYCSQDLIVDRELDKRLLHLTENERKIWVLDQVINNRGVYADVQSAKAALDVVEDEKAALNKEIRRLTDEQVASSQAHIQLKDWVVSHGVQTKGVGKDAVYKILARKDTPEIVREVLKIRQEASKSSTSKLAAIIARACRDQRLRGIFQYHGAGTGRWAGRGVQPHNFPRTKYDESIFDAINGDDARETISLLYGSPMSAVSECLRGFLRAVKGHELIAADFSAIEARVLAWLASEEAVLGLFRSGGDPYIQAAMSIFGVPASKVTKEMRAVGKVAILALGYEGGVEAFQSMAKNYQVSMAPAFPSLWKSASSERRDRALKRWRSYEGETAAYNERALKRGKPKAVKDLIPKEEFIASELTKIAWREANQNIVAFWKHIEAQATAAVENPGQVQMVRRCPRGHHLAFVKKGSFLLCRLPSGRRLVYPYPKVETHKTPWGQPKKMLTYKNEVQRKWIRVKSYGGHLTENVVQAIAADLLREFLVRSEAKGWPIVLHVHDEGVAEVPIGSVSVEEFEKLASVVPEWAAGLPIAAEGWRGDRYRK